MTLSKGYRSIMNENAEKRQMASHQPAGFSIDGMRYHDVLLSNKMIDELSENWMLFFKSRIPQYPNSFSGKGIVICGGGIKYFTCAWVNIYLLRYNKCTLPIELWYNDGELNDEVIDELSKLHVVCKNTSQYSSHAQFGYGIKPFAIINSSFREVLYLDADNNCISDPSYLFECEGYLNTGALFWPDFWKTAPDNPIWKIIDSTDYDEYEQESGQMLINKETCWESLHVCLHFNQERDIYYKFLLGDKDTFKFAWKALKKSYVMIKTNVGHCGYAKLDNPILCAGIAMVQHDPNGNVLFIHQNLAKWNMVKDGEYLWQSIKRFKPTAVSRKFLQKKIRFPNGGTGIVFDIDGDVEKIDCDADIREKHYYCLKVLSALRNSSFYHRFILHLYIARSRQEI